MKRYTSLFESVPSTQQFMDWCHERHYGWAELHRVDKLSPSIVEEYLIKANRPHTEKDVREFKQLIIDSWKKKSENL